MSRLIWLVTEQLFKGKGTPVTLGAPLFPRPGSISPLCIIPSGGVFALFIKAFQDSNFKTKVIGVIPGDSLKDCYQRWGMDKHSTKAWIQVLCQDMTGWIQLEHIKQIYEIDQDQNGETEQKLVYPYPDDG